ncbi:MAG: YbhB/YbcL family Raf kinase inhibitor-like protein [Thermoleophilia bacterium]|nr:YbhB/YbcL family Raf kinase inhibitor-like protein [Thermoleophilia bacterium]
MRGPLALGALALAALTGCAGEPPGPTTGPAVEGFELSVAAGGTTIDARFGCDGDDVSPALAWRGLPEGTRELVLVLEDPDADGFTHWLVFGLSPAVDSLPENIPGDSKIESPGPLRQGRNDFDEIGYDGPCPPEGETHRYAFRLLAIDRELGLEPGSDRDAFERSIAGNVLAEASATASYGR